MKNVKWGDKSANDIAALAKLDTETLKKMRDDLHRAANNVSTALNIKKTAEHRHSHPPPSKHKGD